MKHWEVGRESVLPRGGGRQTEREREREREGAELLYYVSLSVRRASDRAPVTARETLECAEDGGARFAVLHGYHGAAVSVRIARQPSPQ